uniref:Acid phosphatase n=1 Tax=Myoviridae sp. ctWb16 TaxID=2827690 RepID=A0A8S5T055_9CAUD|nr:MAG TPA: acid phosphatase [Myoviridae sp. ctWb16]
MKHLKTKISFFDIDETIFHTHALINVVKNEQIIKKLTNKEFNTYKLQDGESFDFSEFRDSSVFYNTSEPINNVIKLVKRYIDNIKGNDRVIFLTAREDFKDKNKFLETFRKYGINIDHPNVYVERSGNLKFIEKVHQRKNFIVRKYLKTKLYTDVKMYDDSHNNLSNFMMLQKSFPKCNFNAIQVIGNGKLKKF